MTSLPAVDGTLFALGATGGLAAPAVATMTGLTVIAGASAWTAAREEFGRFRGARDRLALAFIAVASTLLAVSAAAAGAVVGAHVPLQVIPTSAGVALLALSADLMGFTLPRVKGVPLPTLVIVTGVLLEVLAWTL